jgi:hypothetical protein
MPAGGDDGRMLVYFFDLKRFVRVFFLTFIPSWEILVVKVFFFAALA